MFRRKELVVEGGRLVRFGIVGLCATFVYAATTLLAIEAFQLPAVSASIIGQVTAMGISYFGHLIFSFRVTANHRHFAWKFLTVAAFTFALNGVVTWGLTDVFGAGHRISVATVAVLIPVVNYV